MSADLKFCGCPTRAETVSSNLFGINSPSFLPFSKMRKYEMLNASKRLFSNYASSQRGRLREVEIFFLADSSVGIKKIRPNVFNVFSYLV